MDKELLQQKELALQMFLCPLEFTLCTLIFLHIFTTKWGLASPSLHIGIALAHYEVWLQFMEFHLTHHTKSTVIYSRASFFFF